MGIKIERPIVEAGKRVIAVSDIHGHLRILLELLNKIGYNKDDILVLVGDMVEKGEESLATLKYLIELSEDRKVYAVCGNCDAIALEINQNEKNEELLRYIHFRKQTLVGEMIQELQIPIHPRLDMLSVKFMLRQSFEKEIAWIQGLPHVLELGNYVFAHAGLIPGKEEQMKPSQVMKADAIMERGYEFEKYHVFGHWPVSLYCKKIPDCTPRVDSKGKLVGIDGGNVIKKDGQLNAMIIPDAFKDEFSFEYVDALPKAKLKNTQEGRAEDAFIIHWTDNRVLPLRREKEFTYCEHITSGHKMWILNSYLSEKKDGWHSEDITDYQVPAMFGETVSVIEDTSRGYYIKKNGVCGWYYGLLDFQR